MRRLVAAGFVVVALATSACAGSRPALPDDDGVAREVDEAPPGDIVDEDDREPVVLRLAVGTEWSGDPADAGPASVVVRVLADLLHEGLTRSGADGEPLPALAERWVVSEDRLTWTFVLRETLVDGAGASVTARDVMRSLDHVAARGPSDNAAVALTAITGWNDRMTGVSGGVAGLSAPDDTTLVIRLDRPFELVAHVLAAPAFGIVGQGDDDAVRTTGAYRYGESDQVLVAVDDAAPVDRIELVEASDGEGADLLAARSVDWAILAAGSGADDIPGDIIRQPLDIRVAIAVRLPDAAERHGVLAAIDPLALTTGVVAFAPLPSPIVEAERTTPASVRVDIPAGRLEPIAEALAGQLEAAGIAVERVASDEATFAGRVSSGEALVFPVVLAGGTDIVVNALQTFAPGAVDDVFGVASDTRASLAAGIESQQDATQRDLLLAALEQSALDDGLMRLVGRLEVRIGIGADLSGLTHNADGTLVLDDVVEATPEAG